MTRLVFNGGNDSLIAKCGRLLSGHAKSRPNGGCDSFAEKRTPATAARGIVSGGALREFAGTVIPEIIFIAAAVIWLILPLSVRTIFRECQTSLACVSLIAAGAFRFVQNFPPRQGKSQFRIMAEIRKMRLCGAEG